jgi:hypothetical protein
MMVCTQVHGTMMDFSLQRCDDQLYLWHADIEVWNLEE